MDMTSEKETLEEAIEEVVKEKPKRTKVILNSYGNILSFLDGKQTKKKGKDVEVFFNLDDSVSIVTLNTNVVTFTRPVENTMVIRIPEGQEFPNEYLPDGYSVSQEESVLSLTRPNGTVSEIVKNIIKVQL
tara:strand:+ start:1012 stop:1404 length:393 start_codon:yes stop_codon:yes gene_type:complete